MPFDGVEVRDRELSAYDALLVPPATLPSPWPWYRRCAAALCRKLHALLYLPLTPETAVAVVRLLSEARALIAAREAWVQRMYETPFGQRCAVGALYRIGVRGGVDPALVWRTHDALLRIALRRGYPTVEMMNDRSSHEHVLAAFDEAIATARRRVHVTTEV